jgi:hypothetical protein
MQQDSAQPVLKEPSPAVEKDWAKSREWGFRREGGKKVDLVMLRTDMREILGKKERRTGRERLRVLSSSTKALYRL